ncbi:MAG TPA: molybdenum cofactor guanylyltransferase MobA [Burkholderiaceae bacterium]|nr:molybdenum cofactor guanylyltransferase MobA [Burkholderiaceae bacterium]
MSRDGCGIDKALQPYRGRPLIEHVIERLRPQVTTLLINTNHPADAYRRFGHPVVADRRSDRPGPLAGLQAGFAAAATPLLACVPCDAPLLPHDLIARLLEPMLRAPAGEAPWISVARAGGQVHPVCLLADRRVLPSIDASLAAGDHRMGGWMARLSHCVVDFDDERAFHNVNTPADLER